MQKYQESYLKQQQFQKEHKLRQQLKHDQQQQQ